MACPVARTLDVVGEWWTLLVVRDALMGARRFDDFRGTGTGIADNILTARLRRLVDERIFERRRYQVRPERYEYLLTEKGQALAPVVASLRAWGKQWTRGKDDSLQLVHATCGHEVAFRAYCEECGELLTRDQVKAERPPRSATGVTTGAASAPVG